MARSRETPASDRRVDQRVAPAEESLPLQIFVNYRRDTSAGDAQALYDRLKQHFGAENVFFDRASLSGGMNWLKEIKARGAAAGVVVSLIARGWDTIMEERARRGEHDFVRLELEAALKRGSRAHVVPVLVDDADMPKLPGLLKPLAHRHAEHLRHERWDDDVGHLIEVLERLPTNPVEGPEFEAGEGPEATAGRGGREEAEGGQPPEPQLGAAAPAPDGRHFDQVIRYLRPGAIVIFVGAGANASDRAGAWHEGCGELPDTHELAQALSTLLEEEESVVSVPPDLARVSQYLAVTSGPADLYNALRSFLAVDCDPTPVHEFLATLPARLDRSGFANRFQLIVTTNYDLALERAFDQAEEPYDLVVYQASGPDKGKFLHVPIEGEPRPIDDPNGYIELPFDETGALKRTVIVKIHGAVESREKHYPWSENYVITEDDYIDYLSQRQIADVVPMDILSKLRGSHYLFLGYTMRDWNLRVFLQRLWRGQKLKAKSWAIQPEPDFLEKEFWDQLDVDLFAAPLTAYLNGLGEHIAAAAQAGIGT
jgi:SIR2-like domain/TIR domain